MDQTSPTRTNRSRTLTLLPLALALAAGSALARSTAPDGPPAPPSAPSPAPSAPAAEPPRSAQTARPILRELTRTGDSRAGSRTMRISLPNGRFILHEGTWVRDSRARSANPAAAPTAGAPVSREMTTVHDGDTKARSFTLILPSNFSFSRQSTMTRSAPGPAAGRTTDGAARLAGPATDKPAPATSGELGPHEAKHARQHSTPHAKQPTGTDKKPAAPTKDKPGPVKDPRHAADQKSTDVKGKPAAATSTGKQRDKK